MAHHFRHHCHPTIPTPTTYHCYCSSSTTVSHRPPPPLPPPPEPLLLIQCQSIHPIPPPQPPKSHHKQIHQNQENEHEESTLNPMISSLLRRITALESNIRRHSSSPSFSLRHAAAKTIQTHFRAFLVRRSQILRQLKQLAYIKSALCSLKSTHSNNAHSDSRTLSLKATTLLRKLDLIQGGDPMIRDGKKSIKRELVRFTDYLDELSFKRYQLSSVRIGMKSRVSKKGEKELLEKLRKKLEKLEGLSGVCDEDEEEEDVVELENAKTRVNGKSGGSQVRNGVMVKRHSGVQGKTKKKVSFAEDGNVYVVYRSNGADCDSECDRFDGSDLVDAVELSREVEDIGNGDDEEEEEANTDDIESPESSDSDGGSGRNAVAESDNMDDPIEKEDGRRFVFCAPMPVKMESRPELMNKMTVKGTN